MGTTKRPVYRLVVADSRSPRDGRFIEAIGFYDPLPNPAVVRIDADKVHVWMRRGARPSDSARQLLVRQGILAAGARPAGWDARPAAAGAAPDEGAGPVTAGTPPRRSSEIAAGLPPAAPPAPADEAALSDDVAPQNETALPDGAAAPEPDTESQA
jgi:small subunit ribosomal protein S16